ncbi:DUF1254 domain-containing protein [Rhizobium leguminosarum]|uniref:DUF1254 domain-containing protein n=1 Tax=Rhizobium leguminosarum TaxID=384 RepID=UPI0036D97FB4
MRSLFTSSLIVAALALAFTTQTAQSQTPSHYDDLATLPFEQGYIAKSNDPKLLDELFFQRAVQTYLWALPALSMYGMKEGSEKVFGSGYNVLPIFKQRLNAKTLITTPNSDVIYALGYLDLKQDGPMVIEVPPGLQGILDDFFQRPIPSVGEIDGRKWSGDVGLPGPDKGKGGQYLILPPDYEGDVPPGYLTYRSGTYGVFVFWRGFFQDPKQLEEPVKVMEQTRIYPLGKKETAKPMQFPDASGVAINMLYPQDGTAFDMLARFIDHEYVDPADTYMRGVAAALGIVKGQPFAPDAKARALLDKAARTATRIGHVVVYTPSPLVKDQLWYNDRQYLNAFPGNATFTSDTFSYLDARTAFFTYAYSASPAMALSIENVGAKYLVAYRDANGDFLSGDQHYKLDVPKDVPAAIFWSVTVYDPITGSGLDNGQPFPSLNTMDKPVQNADGSFDIYFGPTSPGEGKNWLATLPGKGFFTILRLYGPKKAFFDQTWKPDDMIEVK